jgi:hypothetical protein
MPAQIDQRRGTANAREPAGGLGGNSSIVSWWLARSSHARCIRSRSVRSVRDTALAAKVPHAAALLRYRAALVNRGGSMNRVELANGGSDMARSLRLQAGAQSVSQPPAPTIALDATSQ